MNTNLKVTVACVNKGNTAQAASGWKFGKGSEDWWIDVGKSWPFSFSTIAGFVCFFPSCFLGTSDFFAEPWGQMRVNPWKWKLCVDAPSC